MGHGVKWGSSETVSARDTQDGGRSATCDQCVLNTMTATAVLHWVIAQLKISLNTKQTLTRLLKGGPPLTASFYMAGLLGQIRNLAFYFPKALDHGSLTFCKNPEQRACTHVTPTLQNPGVWFSIVYTHTC